jgi:ribosomal protein S18 acetylase RimI-like enzyme
MRLTRELARCFEDHLADHFEDLMRASLAEPGNIEGYAFYRDGAIRVTSSTNPHAAWATCAYHLNQQPSEAVRRAIGFFREQGIPAKARIIPDGFSPAQADVLTELGLRQIGFHAILWAPLDGESPSCDAVDIREATSPEEIDAHIDIQLAAYHVPQEAIEKLKPLRRHWRKIPHLKFYLAYEGEAPVAQAILDCRGEIAYLASAGTLPDRRQRGYQTALIRRRLADAQAMGARVVFGGADFESTSRTNQMACGLQVAYTAAWWCEAGAKLG